MKKLITFLTLISLPILSHAIRYTDKVRLPIWDEHSGAAIFIEHGHHEIHEGDAFYIEGSSQVTNGQIVEFIVKTPNTAEWAHMTFDYNSSAADFMFVAYEGVTVSTTGATAVTPMNHDRNSAEVSTLQVWKSTGTGTTSATIAYGPFTLGTPSPSASARKPGDQANRNEKILKQNTWYVFRFTNGTTTQYINFKASWYEHTNH